MKLTTLTFFSAFFLFTVDSFSQSTFSTIHSLFQANCTVGCHTGASPSGNLNLSGTTTAVYNNIVNVTPVNPAAALKGDKLIDPGYPHRSFLLRKCNNGLDPDNGIVAAEGNAMPDGQPALQNEEIELIRQWIVKGAPQTGNVVDTAIINKYYSGKGINSIAVAPPKPTDPGSFQIHVGKIFIAPQSEVEYFLKYDLKLADTVKVDRINVVMAPQSHHFIIYKLLPGVASSFPNGLRLMNAFGVGSSTGNNTLVSAWQGNRDDSLPPNTAYLWETSSVLDFNYHIPNYNNDSVLAVDVYMDVYTLPKTDPAEIMYSTLINNLAINIPADGQPHTFTKHDFSTAETHLWNVWMLASHTHKYGTDFDIFLRTPGGTQGTQVYEGFYDPTYTFNQGYYGWQHPPVLNFHKVLGNPLVLNPNEGLIQKATYRNYGSAAVSFGFTTDDEMMLYYIQYTLGSLITSTNKLLPKPFSVDVYPNPFTTSAVISYELKKNATVKIELLDVVGKHITTVVKSKEFAGNHQITIGGERLALQNGIYILKLTIDDVVLTKRIVLNK